MNTDLYEQFVTLKGLGKKTEAKNAVDAFIASFTTPEETREWVFRFLESGNYGHRIRHEIYEKLVYPVLLKGYLANDVLSIKWLAKTLPNLYYVKSRDKVFEEKSKFSLFREAYTLEPDEESKAYLLEHLISCFDYAEHEWSEAILYGGNLYGRADAQYIEECDDLLKEVDFARRLDDRKKYEQLLSQFETTGKELIRRLQEPT